MPLLDHLPFITAKPSEMLLLCESEFVAPARSTTEYHQPSRPISQLLSLPFDQTEGAILLEVFFIAHLHSVQVGMMSGGCMCDRSSQVSQTALFPNMSR
eukprot:SAG31_NODE_891_length_11186_cov_6.643366_6_plen_99_part_00